MLFIQSVLESATSTLSSASDSPQLDAEILLCKVLSRNRAYLRTWPEKLVTEPQHQQFQKLLTQRYQGQPIAYITGSKEFWSRQFIINTDVLIPRPETELIVELALELIPDNQPLSIIDMGTGSGVIAVTLAAEKPKITVTAVDISQEALNIAKLNAEKHQLYTLQFINSNWFSNLEKHHYDLIISNPPYIDAEDAHLQQGDLRFEPKAALIAKNQGQQDISHLADTSRQYLKPGGHLLIEHGYNQQQAVKMIFTQLNYSQIICHRDLAGQPRVTSAQWFPTTQKMK